MLFRSQKAEAKFKEFEKETPHYDMGIHNWYVDKSMKPMIELVYAWDEISKLIGPEYVLHPQPNALKVVSGNGMFIHSDSPGRDMCHILSQPDIYQTCCLLDFGVVAYFGEFDGGEVFYSDLNKSIKPEARSLILHRADIHHGVREVTKGIRYYATAFLLEI